jgi:hypothetical protein
MDQLQAVRAGPWKLYLPLESKFINNARKADTAKLELYDVRHDVAEQHEMSARNADVVQRLLSLAEQARAELGDVDRAGKGQRPAGSVERPTARLPTE